MHLEDLMLKILMLISHSIKAFFLLLSVSGITILKMDLPSAFPLADEFRTTVGALEVIIDLSYSSI